MRYITARQTHKCSVCKGVILEGEICIQSQSRHYLMYHEECHAERFGDGTWYRPNNNRPEQEIRGGINE